MLRAGPDATGWLAPALAITGAITALRLVLLAFNQTDLFVDESQYWFWGQHFAFGYYSKPPLIAWVIGAVTALSGSDAPFWVRAPAPVFHGATALILAALAARICGRKVAILVAAAYATLPMVALGSLLISTDTIMAPFFAAAVYFHMRLAETRLPGHAMLAGAMAGLAVLAKYAGVYFLLGAALGAMLIPALRIGWWNALALCAAFAAVVAPNVWWNLGHGLVTASHTMDNVGWVRQAQPLASLNPAGLAEFFFSQFAVFGPVLFAALVWATFRPRQANAGRLLVFVLPAIVIVCAQAVMDRAYANWAASAYFAGTIVAVAVLAGRPGLLALSFAVNGVVAVALPALAIFPTLMPDGQKPILSRYLGREALSLQLLHLAKVQGLPIVADRRDVLADLFYTGRNAGVSIHAPRPAGRPANHYEQTQALPQGTAGQVLYVTASAPLCNGAPATPVAPLDLTGGAYADVPLAVYRINAACLDG